MKIVLLAAAAVALHAVTAVEASAQSKAASDPPTAAADMQLRPGDLLRIRVWPDSSLGGEFRIEESGHVFLPAMGEVRVLGRPFEALRTDLRDRYGAAMKMPVVTITPVFRVSVLGAVQRPGLYVVEPTELLFDVISQAGGFREGADRSSVRVVRVDQVIEIDADRALTLGEAEAMVSLRSGDRIVVPQRERFFSGENVRILLQSATFAVSLFTLLTR